MNYDKIILELLSRVQNLEDEVDKLKGMALSPEAELAAEAEENGGGITRSQARDYAISQLKARFPEYVVQKAGRKDGSGILLNLPGHKVPCKIKFSYSRVYQTKNSWHSIRLSEVMDEVSYCLFAVAEDDGTWHFFLYGTDELLAYSENHRLDPSAETLHLYFHVEDGKAVERRETPVDVTDHLDNWDVLAPGKIQF